MSTSAHVAHSHRPRIHTPGYRRPATCRSSVDIFDTTLRDGSQQEGLSLTVDDKLRVAEQLDHLGVAYIEGGWPGANPKDEEFFARAPVELRLSTATLVAFGSTRRPGVRADDDEVLRNLVKAGTEAVCIVAKASEMHVTDALRTSLDEALAMAADSVAFLRDHDLRVFFDAEHFFDGYKDEPGIQPARAPCCGRRGRRDIGALRHERRDPAPRGRADRGRGGGYVRLPDRCALPQRRGLRGRQFARRRYGPAPPRCRAA